jgi:hypothetical protein
MPDKLYEIQHCAAYQCFVSVREARRVSVSSFDSEIGQMLMY